jgi:two-component system OmpR family sensor kinase
MSIKLRLTAWYSGILAVMLLGLSAAIYGVVYINTYGDLKARVQKQVAQLQLVPHWGYDDSLLNVEVNLSQAKSLEEANMLVQISIYDRRPVQQSDNMRYLGLEFDVPDQSKIMEEKGFKQLTLGGYHFIMYQMPLLNPDNKPLAVLQVAAPTSQEDRLMERLKNILVVGSFATLVAAFTFGLFLARKAMSPIGKVIEAANGIQTGTDLSSRIEYNGPPDEIGRLVQTLNSMLGRMEGFYTDLEESYAAQRRFVSDASHELRTPLTTIRGNIDLLKKVWEMEPGGNPALDEATIRQMSVESVHDIADEAKRMSRLVADMLSLARADTGERAGGS